VTENDFADLERLLTKFLVEKYPALKGKFKVKFEPYTTADEFEEFLKCPNVDKSLQRALNNPDIRANFKGLKEPI
jgi:hypothetical protein